MNIRVLSSKIGEAPSGSARRWSWVRCWMQSSAAFTIEDGLRATSSMLYAKIHDGSLFVANRCRNRALWRERLHPPREFPKDGVRALFADSRRCALDWFVRGSGPLQRRSHRQYTTQDGLANNSVVSIDQDKDGRCGIRHA